MRQKRIRKNTQFYTSQSKSERKEKEIKIIPFKEQHEITKDTTPLKRILPLENMLIWSYCKHHGWWPGRIANRGELDGPLDPPDDPTRWVRWFGDHKFTEVYVDALAGFHEFDRYFCKKKFDRNSNYRLAVIEALQEACHRSGRNFNDLDEVVNWAMQDFLPGGYRNILPEIEEDEKVKYEKFDPSKTSSPRKYSKGAEIDIEMTNTELTKRKKKVLNHVHNGNLKIGDVCLRCGDQVIEMDHPFFIGGLCFSCKPEYLETMIQTNGKLIFCVICGCEGDILQCVKEGCDRRFCMDCITAFTNIPSLKRRQRDKWICYLCKDDPIHGILTRRENWSENIHYCLPENSSYVPMQDIAFSRKKKIRVLSLFDGISVGLLTLKKLHFDVECYYASEIDENALSISQANHPEITHVGDVCDINNKQLLEWGPFDLVLGGSPCNDLAIVNPVRKGLWSDEGSGWLFFEFFRIMNACSLAAASKQQPFFWLFENVARMDGKTRESISHYLQANPVLLDAGEVSAAHRPRLFWGNLPGMLRPLTPEPDDKLTLQECLENGRSALVKKVGTITTNAETVSNKAIQEKYPVMDSSNLRKDILWLTEIERTFGLPDHYTDKSNISCTKRRALLGRTWSVPVIRHLLEPLRDFYLP